MTELPPQPICGLQEDSRRGWRYVCVLPKGHPRVGPFKHHFGWVAGPGADPDGPGPDPDAPQPLPRRTPGQEGAQVPLNPTNEPGVYGLPRHGRQPEDYRPPPTTDDAEKVRRREEDRERWRREQEERPRRPGNVGHIPTTTEMEAEEERRSRERDTQELPPFKPGEGLESGGGLVPGSRTDDPDWDKGGYTGPRGIDDSDEPMHNVDDVKERRRKKPGSTPETSNETPTGGGTTMASVAEVKGALRASMVKMSEAQQVIHNAMALLDEGMSMAMATLEGSDPEAMSSIAGGFELAKNDLLDALQKGEATKEHAEQFMASL